MQYCDVLSCLLLFSFNIILRFRTKQNVIPYLKMYVQVQPSTYFVKPLNGLYLPKRAYIF